MPQLDLGTVLAASDVTIAPSERDDERAARLANERRSKFLEDIRNMVLFIAVLITLLSIGGLCAHLIFFDHTATPETQRWAQTALTALVSGGAAFLFGRAVGSAK